MSTDLREQFERAYPVEERRRPAASPLWRRGRQQRSRRMVATMGAGLAALAVVAVAAPKLAEQQPSVPYVEEGLRETEPDPSGDPIDLVEVEPLPSGTIRAILATRDPIEDPGPDVGGLSMQAGMLADGIITADEYVRALEAAVTCVQERGFEAHIVRDGGLVDPAIPPGLVFMLASETPPGSPDPGDAMEQCRAQWSWQVEQIWTAQLQPSPEESERLWQEFRQCADEHGLGLFEPPPDAGESPTGSLDDCYP